MNDDSCIGIATHNKIVESLQQEVDRLREALEEIRHSGSVEYARRRAERALEAPAP